MSEEALVLLSARDGQGAYRRTLGEARFDGGKLVSCTIQKKDVPVWRQRLASLYAELAIIEREGGTGPG